MSSQAIALADWYAANRAAGDSERYRAACIAERYYFSLQHDDKHDWHDKSVPLRERKPRIVVPLYRKIIEQIDRFIWSGDHAPKAIVQPTKEDGETDDEIGPLLDADQAEVLTAFIARLVKQAKLLPAAREYSKKAMVTTSALVLVGVQAGYVNCYVHGGKDCTPVFRADNPRELESVEIKYKFQKEETVGAMTKKTWYWYRRVIDQQDDTVYKEMPVRPDSHDPEWEVDEDRSVHHGLGFFPGRWVRTLPTCDDAIDGSPVIDPAMHDALDAISYTVSQKQRAVEYGCDPQPYRVGVPEDQRMELAKSPGAVWDLPAVDGGKAPVGFLEAEGTGAERAGEHVKELQQLVREIVGVVDSSPEIHARNVTGVALELLYAPMLALAADLRFDLGDEAYVGLICTALRLVTVLVQERGEDVWIPGVKKATAIIKKAQLDGVWLDLPVTLEWPPAFRESEQDRDFRVRYTVAAQQAGIITSDTATRHMAPMFHIEDPAAEAEACEEEAEGDLADTKAMYLAHLRGAKVSAAEESNEGGETTAASDDGEA